MKKSLVFRLCLIVILLAILWASNHYNFPYPEIMGDVLIICGVLVGMWGTHIDKQK